jgi:ABC-type multidrug transport system ATPase subunit
MAAPAITVDSLVVRYGETVALDGVSFDVPRGSVVGVLGPNGAGKTTLIRVLGTQQPPSTGRVSVAGFDVVAQRRQVQRRVGLTGQYASLDEDLTPTENLHLVAALAGVPRVVATRRIAQLLESWNLGDGARRLGRLSGGTRRRVDLAAGLVTGPEVVVLDEPTTGLDPHARVQLWEQVADLAAHGVTIVLTTQYLEEADRLADRVLFLDHGRIRADGTPAEVKARIGGEVVNATLSREHDVDAAVIALNGLVPHVTTDSRSGRITARVADASSAADVVAALRKLGLPIEELAVTTPTLDDAFHLLTAR